jgi:hypothetical protein
MVTQDGGAPAQQLGQRVCGWRVQRQRANVFHDYQIRTLERG